MPRAADDRDVGVALLDRRTDAATHVRFTHERLSLERRCRTTLSERPGPHRAHRFADGIKEHHRMLPPTSIRTPSLAVFFDKPAPPRFTILKTRSERQSFQRIAPTRRRFTRRISFSP